MKSLRTRRCTFTVSRWVFCVFCWCVAGLCMGRANVLSNRGFGFLKPACRTGGDTIFKEARKTTDPNCFNSKRETANANHDFHSSLAEIHYNAKSKSLEISLRVFSDDLDVALTKDNNRTIRVDATAAADPLLKQYLGKHFAFTDSKNARKPIVWVGKEIAVDVTWIYFEIPIAENLNGMRFENSILCELFEDQVNIVNLNYQNQKRTYLFKVDQAVQMIGL
jgi:hypothetical protein